MKNYVMILCLLLLNSSCEDVIEVDLNNADPKLVIEASINWQKTTPGNIQSIKLSLTAPYFDTIIPPATGATVYITDENNSNYHFIEDDTSGIYINTSFIPRLNKTFTLNITYNDEVYVGKETFKSVAPFEYVEQNNNGGFSGEEIELKAYFDDPVSETNFYFFEFRSNIPVTRSLSVYEDRYTNGNKNFGFYSEEDLKIGDKVIIRNYGVSERFYNYMFILLQQNNDANGGPFETQPAIVRGNCINQTNPDNFPLGYFRLSEVAEEIYTIQ